MEMRIISYRLYTISYQIWYEFFACFFLMQLRHPRLVHYLPAQDFLPQPCSSCLRLIFHNYVTLPVPFSRWHQEWAISWRQNVTAPFQDTSPSCRLKDCSCKDDLTLLIPRQLQHYGRKLPRSLPVRFLRTSLPMPEQFLPSHASRPAKK